MVFLLHPPACKMVHSLWVCLRAHLRSGLILRVSPAGCFPDVIWDRVLNILQMALWLISFQPPISFLKNITINHQPSIYGHQIIYGDQIISFQHPFMDIYGMVVGQTMPSTIYSCWSWGMKTGSHSMSPFLGSNLVNPVVTWCIMIPISYLLFYHQIHIYSHPYHKIPVVFCCFTHIIAGWWFQPIWKILVNWDDYSQYMVKIKKYSKPPTSIKITRSRVSSTLTVRVPFFDLLRWIAWAGVQRGSGFPNSQAGRKLVSIVV